MKRVLPPPVVQLLKLAAALVVLVYLVQFVEWDRVIESLRHAHPGLVAGACALLVANLGLEVWLWHRLSRLVSARPGRADSLAAVLCGHAAGLLTPARSGEVVARALYTNQVDAWQAGTMALFHRMLDFHAIVLFSAPACLYFLYSAQPPPLLLWQGVTVAGFALAVFLTVVMMRPTGLQRMLERVIKRSTWRQRVAFLSAWPARERLTAIALAVGRYAIYVGQYALLLHAFGLESGPAASLLAGAVVFYAKLLVPPVTFTDVGIRESVSVYVGLILGIESATAFNAAFVLFLINLVLPAFIGAPFLVRGRRASPARASSTPEAPARP